MKRELGIARCGLACSLCSENDKCHGCNSGECSGVNWCINYKCSIEKKLDKCSSCKEECNRGLLGKVKARGFTEFIRRYGEEELLDCLQKKRNERSCIS